MIEYDVKLTLHENIIRFLANRCNATFGYCYNMSSVYHLSVTRVYCDKMAEARIMQFSLKCSAMPNSLPAQFDSEIRRGSP